MDSLRAPTGLCGEIGFCTLPWVSSENWESQLISRFQLMGIHTAPLLNKRWRLTPRSCTTPWIGCLPSWIHMTNATCMWDRLMKKQLTSSKKNTANVVYAQPVPVPKPDKTLVPSISTKGTCNTDLGNQKKRICLWPGKRTLLMQPLEVSQQSTKLSLTFPWILWGWWMKKNSTHSWTPTLASKTTMQRKKTNQLILSLPLQQKKLFLSLSTLTVLRPQVFLTHSNRVTGASISTYHPWARYRQKSTKRKWKIFLTDTPIFFHVTRQTADLFTLTKNKSRLTLN